MTCDWIGQKSYQNMSPAQLDLNGPSVSPWRCHLSGYDDYDVDEVNVPREVPEKRVKWAMVKTNEPLTGVASYSIVMSCRVLSYKRWSSGRYQKQIDNRVVI